MNTQKTERKCAECQRDISHKHPNARFCRTRCKDRHHNRQDPRKRAYLGLYSEEAETTPHPFSEDAFRE